MLTNEPLESCFKNEQIHNLNTWFKSGHTAVSLNDAISFPGRTNSYPYTLLYRLSYQAEQRDLKKEVVCVSHNLFYVLCVELGSWRVGSDGGTGGMKLKYWTWNLLPAFLHKSFR